MSAPLFPARSSSWSAGRPSSSPARTSRAGWRSSSRSSSCWWGKLSPPSWNEGSSVGELPDMLSAKLSAFLTPSFPHPHLELIYTVKFTEPPLLSPLFHDPLPPLMRTSYLEAPHRRIRLAVNDGAAVSLRSRVIVRVRVYLSASGGTVSVTARKVHNVPCRWNLTNAWKCNECAGHQSRAREGGIVVHFLIHLMFRFNSFEILGFLASAVFRQPCLPPAHFIGKGLIEKIGKWKEKKPYKTPRHPLLCPTLLDTSARKKGGGRGGNRRSKR